MNRRMRRIRTVLLLSAAVAIALLMVGVQAADLLQRADLVERRLALLGARHADAAAVVIVSIEDRTHDRSDEDGNLRSWPFDRRRHADVIEQLHARPARR